jgi:hypothetical protein
LKSESAPGFIPESCPSSFRNAARDDFGIVPTLPRNPQRLGGRTVEPGPAAERGVFPVRTDQGTLGGAPFGAAELAGSLVERSYVSGLAGKVGLRGFRSFSQVAEKGH